VTRDRFEAEALELLRDCHTPTTLDVERTATALRAAERRGAERGLRYASFEEAWAAMEARGYQYGPDALAAVRFGWELARALPLDEAPDAE
jgi:hypothetical protein